MNVKLILSGLLAATMMSACSSSDQKTKAVARVGKTDTNSVLLNSLNGVTPAMYDEAEKAEFARSLNDLAPRVVVSSTAKVDEKSVCWIRDVGSDIKKGDTLFIDMTKTTALRDGKLVVEYVLTKSSPELVDDTGRGVQSSTKNEMTLGCSSNGSVLTFADVSKALNGALTFVSGK